LCNDMARKWRNMTEMRDPEEIYRESLASVPASVETRPPVITRMEVLPYPDLTRLWVRIEVSAFARFPDLELTVYGPDGQVACTMYMVEIRRTYQSLTLHPRHPSRPGARYVLEVALIRDETLLDTQQLPFDLVFREPQAA